MIRLIYQNHKKYLIYQADLCNIFYPIFSSSYPLHSYVPISDKPTLLFINICNSESISTLSVQLVNTFL
jgi:hypothetical protein